MSNSWRIQEGIRKAIHEQAPEYVELFRDVKYPRIPNAPFDDNYRGYEVYAAQACNVTLMARNIDGAWKIKICYW